MSRRWLLRSGVYFLHTPIRRLEVEAVVSELGTLVARWVNDPIGDSLWDSLLFSTMLRGQEVLAIRNLIAFSPRITNRLAKLALDPKTRAVAPIAQTPATLGIFIHFVPRRLGELAAPVAPISQNHPDARSRNMVPTTIHLRRWVKAQRFSVHSDLDQDRDHGAILVAVTIQPIPVVPSSLHLLVGSPSGSEKAEKVPAHQVNKHLVRVLLQPHPSQQPPLVFALLVPRDRPAWTKFPLPKIGRHKRFLGMSRPQMVVEALRRTPLSIASHLSMHIHPSALLPLVLRTHTRSQEEEVMIIIHCRV